MLQQGDGGRKQILNLGSKLGHQKYIFKLMNIIKTQNEKLYNAKYKLKNE